MNNNFGNRIYELRKEKKLTQEELGELLGINGKSVSKWERGITKPSLSTIFHFFVNVIIEKTINRYINEKMKNKNGDEEI